MTTELRPSPQAAWARLAWYWRRVKCEPTTLYYMDPPVGFYSVLVDPKPPWRRR